MASLLKFCWFVFCSSFLCVLYNVFSVLQLSQPIEKVKVRTLDAESQQLLSKLFKGSPIGFARFGEGGYLLHSFLKWHVDHVKTMLVRADDVWVVTYPRSGTTWTQELVWLLMNDFDYETALKKPLILRYFFLEFTRDSRRKKESIKKETEPEVPSFQEVVEAPSPRFIKTHLPLSLLPDNLLDTTKVVYVARDPRDVAVSFYHLNRLFKVFDYVGDFKSFWNLFVNDLVTCTPYFPHVKEAWARRHHPNMLFIFYEELQLNLPALITRIAKFLGKEVTREQIQKLCEHLDIKNFKNNESINPSSWGEDVSNPGEERFVRNGKSGGWREYFDEGMAAQAQRWLRAQLADTDLRFPGTDTAILSQ